MLNEREVVKKLQELAYRFRGHVKNRQWEQEKHCYDVARNVAAAVEISEKDKLELFGERGERGEILKQGLFPEDEVLKVLEMAGVREGETGKKKGTGGETGRAPGKRKKQKD